MSEVENIQVNGTSEADGESELKKEKVEQEEEKEDEAASPPLTPRQVQLILSTWEPVKEDLQGHGIVLFLK